MQHILQKPFETEGSVCFYGDRPKDDCGKHKALVEKMKYQQANVVADLVIHKGAIV
jgi:hypothetical protein